MAGNSDDLKGFSLHAGIRVVLGLLVVALLTYGAHRVFELYQKHLVKESSENIDSGFKKDIEKKFPEVVGDRTVKPGYLGPKDGVERYLGEKKEKIVKLDKRVQKTLLFTKALYGPMEHELKETLLGWRTNDLFNRYIPVIAPDDKENFQLGVLNSTRIYTKVLFEKLSRNKQDNYVNPKLKEAYDSFMVDETRYIGPSAEFKFEKAIDALKSYGEDVRKGEASFYINPENLDAILSTAIYLFNECETLLKTGSDISTFEADDRFYYSKGVIKVLASVLKSLKTDFSEAIILFEGSGEIISACDDLDIALSINPFIVTEGSMDGILANHRSNLSNQIAKSKKSLVKLRKAILENIALKKKKEKIDKDVKKSEKTDDKKDTDSPKEKDSVKEVEQNIENT